MILLHIRAKEEGENSNLVPRVFQEKDPGNEVREIQPCRLHVKQSKVLSTLNYMLTFLLFV